MELIDLEQESQEEPGPPPGKKRSRRVSPKRTFDKEKVLPALWTIGAGLSILLNIILVVILIFLSRQTFALKNYLQDNLVGGLYYNFILMDEATITANIRVNDTIPIQFDLPLQQDTVVTLTKDTVITAASISLSTGGLNIVNAPTQIILPKGTRLPIALDLIVPVNATIPIKLRVPIKIPLKDTGLHAPFIGLQEVVSPLYQLLSKIPGSWGDVWCLTPFKSCE